MKVTLEELIRAAKKNVATTLVLRFLFPADESDRSDAFSGLVGLCFSAKGGIVIYPTPEESQVYKKGKGGDIYQVTRGCIIDALLKFLAPYAGKSLEEILNTSADKFRYIARAISKDLQNEVDRRCRERKRRIHVNGTEGSEAGDDDADDRSIENLTAPKALLEGGTDTARQEDNRKYSSFLEKNGDALAAELGKGGKEALEDIKLKTSLYPKTYEQSGEMRHMQADITAAMQEWHAISKRAAEIRKARTQECVKRGSQHNGKVLQDLHDLILYGNDENTLVERFPSPNGRGVRIVKVRIK